VIPSITLDFSATKDASRRGCRGMMIWARYTHDIGGNKDP